MIDIHDCFESKQQCVGCAACEQICPVNAITMKKDREGFIYPFVEKTSCVNCNTCESVCPVLRAEKEKAKPVITYAAWNRNEIERLNSSSGGIFSMLARYILQNDGVVFGAAFSEDHYSINHIYIEKEEELNRIQQSKYVQSSIGINKTYRNVKCFLREGRLVLFSGTPCQVEGLIRYLDEYFPNLYTVDVICHGVPSPLIWEKYLKRLEAKVGSTTKEVSFRNKEKGWNDYSLKMTFANGKQYRELAGDDPYLRCFMLNYSLRPSCYTCHFKKENRSADITLGDFWGVEIVFPSMSDGKGCSLVILHSQKGKELWSRIEDATENNLTSLAQASRFNPNFYRSEVMPKRREAFFKDCLSAKNIEKAMYKYIKYASSDRYGLARNIKRGIRQFIDNDKVERIKRIAGRFKR